MTPGEIRLPSASRLGLLDYCRYFPRLPWDQSAPGEAADTGSLIHSLIERHFTGCDLRTGLPLADQKKADKVFARWLKWWDGYAAGRVFWSEVAFLYDVKTGKARVPDAGWQEDGRPRGPNELVAIVDAFTIVDGRGILIDWKTGAIANATPAKSNAQLQVAALCLQSMFGVHEVEASLGWLRQIKDPNLDTAVYDALDLADFQKILRENCAGIATAEPNRGDWCWRCPGKRTCPALEAPAPNGQEGVDFPPW